MGLKKGLWRCEVPGLRVCLYSIWSFETSTSHQSLVSHFIIYNGITDTFLQKMNEATLTWATTTEEKSFHENEGQKK